MCFDKNQNLPKLQHMSGKNLHWCNGVFCHYRESTCEYLLEIFAYHNSRLTHLWRSHDSSIFAPTRWNTMIKLAYCWNGSDHGRCCNINMKICIRGWNEHFKIYHMIIMLQKRKEKKEKKYEGTIVNSKMINVLLQDNF